MKTDKPNTEHGNGTNTVLGVRAVIVKKGAVIEDNFCGKHTVKEDFEARVIERQHVEPLAPYYICANDGKFISGLEEQFQGIGQAFFVNESDTVVKA